MNFIKNSIFYFLVSTLLFACGHKDELQLPKDETPPTIAITLPTTESTYTPGDDIAIDMIIADERKLKEYNVAIALKEASVIETDIEFLEWNNTSLQKEAVSKQEKELDFSIAVPSTIEKDAKTAEIKPGTYTLTFTATDAAGNVTTKKVDIIITNEKALLPVDQAIPTVEIETSTPDQPLMPGDQLAIEFELGDDLDLKSYTLGIALKTLTQATQTDLTFEAWENDSITGALVSGKSATETATIAIPAMINTDTYVQPGIYTISIIAKDAAEKKATATLDIEIGETIVEPVDQSAPTINVKKPTTDQTFTPGEQMPLEFTLTDDVELKDFKVSIAIKNASETTQKDLEFANWTNDNLTTDNISGTSSEQTLSIAIPSTISDDVYVQPGTYTVTIVAKDATDKATTETVDVTIKELKVEQSAPVITIEKPNAEQTFNPGDELTLTYEITDDVNLKSYNISLDIQTPADTKQKDLQFAKWSSDNLASNEISGTAQQLEHKITIPKLIGTDTYVQPGTYVLTILATDASGKTTTKTINIVINELTVEPTDTGNPTVSISKPTSTASFASGEKMNIAFTLEDDLLLKNYKVSVARTGGAEPQQDLTFKAWSNNDLKSEDVSTSPENVSFETTIPEKIGDAYIKPGTYTLTVEVTDATNKSATQKVSFEITEKMVDLTAPGLNISTPTENSAYQPGEAFDLTFEMTDDIDLKDYSVSIAKSDQIAQSFGVKVVELYGKWDFTTVTESVNGTSSSKTVEITVPKYNCVNGDKDDLNPEPGMYTITVTAKDKSDKTTTKTVEIEVEKLVETPVDAANPEVEITAPSNGTEYISGDHVDLTFNLTDDLNLASYKVSVALKEEPASSQNLKIIPITREWKNDNLASGTVSGKSEAVSKKFSIPFEDDENTYDTTPGTYTITVLTTDKAGKTGTKTVDIIIK